MLEFSSMAQDFVEATSSLVGGRTINIMDLSLIHISGWTPDGWFPIG